MLNNAKKILLVLLFLHGLNMQIKAQSVANVDSLERSILASTDDTSKVNALNELCLSYFNSKPEHALSIAEKALTLSQSLNFKQGLATATYNVGVAAWLNGDFSRSTESVEHSMKLYKELHDKNGEGKAINIYASVEKDKGNYEEAITAYFKSLKIWEEIGNNKGIANVHNNIGIIYNNLKQTDLALEHYNKSLEIKRQMGDKNSVAYTLNNIGRIYASNSDFRKALEFYHEALLLFIESDNKTGQSAIYSNLASVYRQQGELEVAIKYTAKDLEFIENSGSKKDLSSSYSNIAELYFLTNKIELSKAYYFKAVKVGLEINSKPELMLAYKGLFNLFAKINDYTGALEYQEKYSVVKDSLLNESNLLSINEMQTKYETDKKEKEIEILSKDKLLQDANSAREKLYRNSVLLGLLLLLVITFFIYSRYVTKKKSNETLSHLNSELESLNVELEKLSLVASNTDSGVMIFDKNLDIEWVNEGFTKLLGYNLDDIQTLGGNLRKISNNPNIDLLIDQCIATKEPLIYESENNLPDGKLIWTQSTLTPVLDEDNTLKKVVIIESDVNKLKEVEELIRNKNQAITDSIEYASTIQDAILLPDDLIKGMFPQSFVLFKPKDVVSGDFYWFFEKNDNIYVAVVDCTGHGVPGAFMSMLGYNFIQNIASDVEIESAAELLERVNDEITKMVKSESEYQHVKTGMDMSLVIINKASKMLQFSGAHNPLYLIRSNELIEYKGDKLSVGDCIDDEKFTNHEIAFNSGDIIYLFSDGFADQVGGPKRKKFYYQPFKDLLLAIHQDEMEVQKHKLDHQLTSWRGAIEQFDDVLIVGIKLT